MRDLRSNIKEEIPPETASNEQIRRMKRELDKDRQVRFSNLLQKDISLSVRNIFCLVANYFDDFLKDYK